MAKRKDAYILGARGFVRTKVIGQATKRERFMLRDAAGITREISRIEAGNLAFDTLIDYPELPSLKTLLDVIVWRDCGTLESPKPCIGDVWLWRELVAIESA